jgi:hypothetical protein
MSWELLKTDGTKIEIIGTQGAKGAKGDKGDKGDTGAQGIQGVQGPQGEQGATGATGAQGIQGEPGADGTALQNVQGTLAVASTFATYSSGTNKLFRYGNVVTSYVVLKPNADATTADEIVVGTLPLGFRPISNVTVVEQGTSLNRFLATFKATGDVSIDRLAGPASSSELMFTSGNWITLSATWITGDAMP